MVVVAGALACALAAFAVGMLSFLGVPANERRFVTRLVDLAERNDVCALVRALWNDGTACEDHDVWTEDGFQLRLKRLWHGNGTRGLVCLQAGLGDSSSTFVLSGANGSLAGVLYRAGYEVWLLDGRGRAPFGHRALDPARDAEFWNWSIHEKIHHDLPVSVSHALSVSGWNSTALIGHSQGGLIILAALTDTSTSLANVTSRAILLAPPISGWSSKFATPEGLLHPLLSLNVFPWVSPYGFNVGSVLSSVRGRVSRLCLAGPALCKLTVCFLAGCGDNSQLARERLARIFSFYPVASSLKNLEHLMECERKGKVVTGISFDTSYNFSTITTPLYFFFGDKDKLVDTRRFENGSRLFPPRVVKKYAIMPGYGHADFVWGENARELLYDKYILNGGAL